jgi:hypothetical protein
MTTPARGYTHTVRWAIAGCASALLVAGCGGGAQPQAAGPRVPHALAYRLAAESDAVAAALERGDSCAAQTAAGRLRSDLTASIARVPSAWQEPLSSRVNALTAELPACTPPAPAPKAKPQQPDEHAKHDKHGDHEMHGDHEKHGKHGKHGGEGGD